MSGQMRNALAGPEGLYSPDSIFWRVNREWLILPAGLRAIALQMAHPLIAAAVNRHSDFRRDPFGRFLRTLTAFMDLSFGAPAQVQEAARRINRQHRQVNGAVADEVTGEMRRFDANDPRLKLWVASTLTDSTLLTYELLVRPLSLAEKETYYAESLRIAPLMGIPGDLIPADYAAFESYVESMLTGNELRVGRDAREIVEAVFYPPFLEPLLRVPRLVAVGLLPSSFREAYNLPWDRKHSRRLRELAILTRSLRPITPDWLAVNPRALLREWSRSQRLLPFAASMLVRTCEGVQSGLRAAWPF